MRAAGGLGAAIAAKRPESARSARPSRKTTCPEAEVHVVGYPAILPSDVDERGRELPIVPGDMTYLREKEEQLNAMLKQRADAVLPTLTTSVWAEGRERGAAPVADAVRQG